MASNINAIIDPYTTEQTVALKLLFTTDLNKDYTVTVSKIADNVTVQQIDDALTAIAASKLFSDSTKGVITTKAGATAVITTVADIDFTLL